MTTVQLEKVFTKNGEYDDLTPEVCSQYAGKNIFNISKVVISNVDISTGQTVGASVICKPENLGSTYIVNNKPFSFNLDKVITDWGSWEIYKTPIILWFEKTNQELSTKDFDVDDNNIITITADLSKARDTIHDVPDTAVEEPQYVTVNIYAVLKEE